MVLHSLVSTLGPKWEQSGGHLGFEAPSVVMQPRSRTWVPLPHDWEHAVQELHEEYSGGLVQTSAPNPENHNH